MYLPAYFNEANIATLVQTIRENPFATLITQDKNGNLIGNHLPFLVEDTENYPKLRGHFAAASSLKEADFSKEVLVVFQGENTYISPNFYPSKAQDGRAVPTWNYVAIHCHGKAKIHNDKKEIYKILDELSHIHESVFPNPWQIEDAPKDYIEKMFNHILGIEIDVSRIDGKFKLSQNQPEINKQGVRDGLASIGIDPKNLVR